MKSHGISWSRCISQTAVILTAITLLACTEALPGQHPVEEIAGYASRAEEAAVQARTYSETATSERKRSEELLAEAKRYLAEAQTAKKFCAEVKRKIPKQRVVYRIKKEKCNCEEEIGEDGEPKKKEGPAYSPSDAPLE